MKNKIDFTHSKFVKSVFTQDAKTQRFCNL